MNVAIAAPEDDFGGFDLELFGIELEHQINTKIKPELRHSLDRQEEAFLNELGKHPKIIAERLRLAQEHADYSRRKERRAFVASGAAARAATREMAGQLAKKWKAPCIAVNRLSGSQSVSA